MVHSLIDKVISALRAAVGDEASVQIEITEGDKLTGSVVSRSFAGLSGNERQDVVWKSLDAHLSPFERTCVVFVVTDTPDEHDEAL
jgi:stress-induced morphogen